MIRSLLFHLLRRSPLPSRSLSAWLASSPAQNSPATRSKKLLPLLAGLLLTPLGCAAIGSSLPLIQPQLKAISLNWQVMPLSQPGAYQIAGRTDLPDQTQLTIIALRYLYPVAAAAQQLNPRPTYSILDYQSATVEQGNWQTQLNLWQVAADGSFQENWQIDQRRLATRFNPTQQVVFLVTLAPVNQIAALQQQLAAKGQMVADRAIRSANGESYLQFHQTQTLPLPSGGTQIPPQLEVENFGWGRRYLIPQEPQNPTQLERPTAPQTTAPTRPEEFLR